MTQYGFRDEALCGLRKGSRGFAEGRLACQRLSRRPRRYGDWKVICASLTSGQETASPLFDVHRFLCAANAAFCAFPWF